MRKVVEKVTTKIRRCWICQKHWPIGTHHFAPIGDDKFKCPDNAHRIY